MDSGEIYATRPAPGVPAPPPASEPASRQVEPSFATQAADPFAEPSRTERAARGTRGRIGGAVAAAGALLANFFAAIKGLILLLPKLKVLASAGTALVSVAAYSLWWGWPFAVGLVVLLFVHEMGHVIALRREGVAASAPMFIPFLGAVISAKSLGKDALAG